MEQKLLPFLFIISDSWAYVSQLAHTTIISSFFLFFFTKADFKYVLKIIGNMNINKGISNGRIFKNTIKLILGFWL